MPEKKLKKDNQNLIFKQNYQTELAAVEVKIKIFEQQKAHQMQEIERQQFYEGMKDEAQANMSNKIVESLKIMKAIKKDFDLN